MAQTPDNLNSDTYNRGAYNDDYVSSDDPDVVIIAGEEETLSTGDDVMLNPADAGPIDATNVVGGGTGQVDQVVNANGSDTTSVYDEALAADRTNEGDWQNSDNPDAIRQDIGDTRAQLSETLDAIQEQLNPDRLKEQAKDLVQDTTQRVTDQAKDAMYDATIGKAEQVVNNVEASARNAGGTLLDTIKGNPIPAALAGIGLGWLILRTRENARNQGGYSNYRGNWNQGNWNRGNYGYDYNAQGGRGGYGYGYAPYSGVGNYSGYGYSDGTNGSNTGVGGTVRNVQGRAGDAVQNVQNRASDAVDTLQDKAGQVQDRAADAVNTLQDKAGQMTDQVQDTAQQVGWQAQMQARRAQGWLEQNINDNPLAVAAIAAAAGIAAGLLIPESAPENRLMGPTRDRLVETAANKAEDAIDRAADVTQSAAKAVGGTASTTSKAADAVSQGTDQVVQKAKNAVESAKDNIESK